MVSRTQRIAKNTIFLYIRMFIITLVSLYTSRVILKILGVDDFGLYNVVGSVVLFCAFFNSALRNATYRYLAFDIGKGNFSNISKTFSMAVNVHILLSVCILLLIELVGVYFLNRYIVIPEDRIFAANVVFQLSLLTFVLSIIQTPFQSLIVANEKMNFYAISSIVEVSLKLSLIFIIPFVVIDKLIFYGFIVTSVAIVVFIMNYIYCRSVFRNINYSFFWDKCLFKQFLSYSGLSMLVNGADVCSRQSMSVFFNWFAGLVGNTALGLMNQVSAGIMNFVSVFENAFGPQIIKSYAADDKTYFMRLIVTSSKLSYILFLIVAIPICINIEFLLDLWLGDYPEILPQMIWAAMLYHLMDSFQAPLYEAVHATGNIKVHQLMMSSIKILGIPIMFFSFKLGCNTSIVILIWSILNVVCAIVRTIYMKILIGLNIRQYFVKVLWLVSLTFVVIILSKSIRSFFDEDITKFFISSVSSVLCVIAGSFLILEKDEREYLYRLPVFKWLYQKKKR